MSNAENDIIWESACERAEREGVLMEAMVDSDIEEIHEYLITGKLPADYESILYRMYKC